MSRIQASIVTLAFILFVGAFFIFLYQHGSLADDLGELITGIFIPLFIFMPMIWREANDKADHVSDLIISPHNLTLLYRYGKTKTFPLDEIESVTINATYRTKGGSSFKRMSGGSTTTILLKNEESFSFEEATNNYAFLCEMIEIDRLLPNFDYILCDTDPAIEDCIAHYNMTGKKYFHDSKAVTIIMYVIPIAAFILVIMNIYLFELNKPIESYNKHLDNAEKIAKSHESHPADKSQENEYLNLGMASYNSGDREKAVIYFNKVIEINDNNSNAYLWRGASKLYSGNKEGATQDFQIYKTRVLKCLKEKTCNRYNEEDLETINKWIVRAE